MSSSSKRDHLELFALPPGEVPQHAVPAGRTNRRRRGDGGAAPAQEGASSRAVAPAPADATSIPGMGPLVIPDGRHDDGRYAGWGDHGRIPPPGEVTAAQLAPTDRAWVRVALECPNHAPAEAHRHGDAPLVHVVPMGHPRDVRCMAGEPVPGYTGVFRPAGGHRDLHPSGTVFPNDMELAAGAKMPVPLYSTKSRAYDDAERAGR